MYLLRKCNLCVKIVLRSVPKICCKRRCFLFIFFLCFLVMVDKFGPPAPWDRMEATLKHLRFYNQLGKKSSSMERYQYLYGMLKDEDLKNQILVEGRPARELYSKYANQEVPAPIGTGMSGGVQKIKITIATVVCGAGDTELEAKVMLKSAVMFSRDADLHFIIFGDEALPSLATWLLELKWTILLLGWDFTFEFRLVSFPKIPDFSWKKVNQPCSSQRLFFPDVLPKLDALLYVDSDTVFISNVTRLWRQFEKMDDHQMVAMGLHMIAPAVGVYQLSKNVPFYGTSGVNSGLILMNLTRLRDFEFKIRVMGIHALYHHRMTMHDQDIFNIIFHSHPDKLFPLKCTFTFYSLYCDRMGGNHCIFEKVPGPRCFCNASLTEGIHVVNGNGGNFLKKDKSLFTTLYQNFAEFDLSKGSYKGLHANLVKDFNTLPYPPCFSLSGELMYQNVRRYILALNLR